MDLKADNVLLDSQLIPTICDLGYACASSERKPPPFFTDVFAPPEVAIPNLKSRYNWTRSDMWYLGTLLYELMFSDTPNCIECRRTKSEPDLDFQLPDRRDEEYQKYFEAGLLIKGLM
jgi:serine/threonine protein kinase